MSALLLLALSVQVDKPDYVTLKDRRRLEGKVTKDDFREVVVREKTKTTTLKADEVQAVEYGSSPPGFVEALGLVDSGRYREGLESIRKAEDAAKLIAEQMSMSPVKRKYPAFKPPEASWWIPYSTYYKAVCLLNTRGYTQASEAFEKLLADHKDFRLVRECYEGALRAAIDRSEPQWDKAKQILEAAAADQGRLGERLVARLEMARAQATLNAQQFDEAIRLFERMAKASDEETAVAGLRGMLAAKGKKGDTDLPQVCDSLISSAKSNKVRMIASAALGEALRARAAQSGRLKEFRDGIVHLVNATVVYYPGLGSGMEADHEEALFSLAACYEGMAQKAQDKAKKLYWTMAAQTYQEILAANPESDRAEEANTKMAAAEAQTAP